MPSSFLPIAFCLFMFIYPSTLLCDNLDSPSTDDTNLNTYIIHVAPTNTVAESNNVDGWYESFLPLTTAEPRLVYTYSEVFTGFAAKLTEKEVKEMAKKEGFVRAYPNDELTLHTTHSPDFLGLRLGEAGLWNTSSLGEGVIIGVLDTGIQPDHPSFHDEGMLPPPAKWKGECELEISCNNKIIGAKSFGAKTALDDDGHGTHTASTAAGNFVKNASAFGLREGRAAGMAPHAHLAVYKVCSDDCKLADLLAALDSAIKDRVDVLSISLGRSSIPYDVDPFALGILSATEKGILVVCSAGNFGPYPASVSNEAPWILTVGASTVDRSFQSILTLGDGRQFRGETLHQVANFSSKSFPLVYSGSQNYNFATHNFLDVDDASDRSIMACNDGYDCGHENCTGAAGMIKIGNVLQGHTIMTTSHFLPVVQVTSSDGCDIISYARSAEAPTASIAFKGTVLGASPAPVVAYFSSRGPSKQSPGILKPDIIAPGVNILAAWNGNPSSGSEDDGKHYFNVVSGTSMAAPHISGIAALIKSVHPDWSPAAIRSAIITSSDANDRDGNPIKDEKLQRASLFTMGAGHVNPTNAAEPGLVYDMDAADYVSYLCGLGQGDVVSGLNVDCSGVKNFTETELNYPSIVLPVWSGTTAVNRTVTNVGDANATYTVEVDVPNGVMVVVHPETLQFSKVNEKKTYTVSARFEAFDHPPRCFTRVEGSLRWVSQKAVVRSPLVVASKRWLQQPK